MGIGMVNQDYPEVVKTIEVAEWEVRRKLGFAQAWPDPDHYRSRPVYAA